MRTIVIMLATSIVLMGCFSGTGSETRPPSYITSLAHQSPAIRNDTFGGSRYAHAWFALVVMEGAQLRPTSPASTPRRMQPDRVSGQP
jgi:hypothetical protein